MKEFPERIAARAENDMNQSACTLGTIKPQRNLTPRACPHRKILMAMGPRCWPSAAKNMYLSSPVLSTTDWSCTCALAQGKFAAKIHKENRLCGHDFVTHVSISVRTEAAAELVDFAEESVEAIWFPAHHKCLEPTAPQRTVLLKLSAIQNNTIYFSTYDPVRAISPIQYCNVAVLP